MKLVQLSAIIAAGAFVLPAAYSREIPLKEAPSQYLAHADLAQSVSIGADFLGRYLPVPGTTIYSDEYLFVEVAIFGAKGSRTELKPDQFSLVINGTALVPQPPGMVTLWNGALEMNPRPQVVTGAPGGGSIEIGDPTRKPRFPGDDPAHTPTTSPVPQVSTDPSGGQVKKTQTPDEAVRASELPQGDHVLPVAGYLFFAYEGKLKKIKHAELHYKGPLGDATLKLR
jgi:hypothetical protein